MKESAAGVSLGHTKFSWESQGATIPVGHASFSWEASPAAPKAQSASSKIEEQGPHGLEEGQRVRVRGLEKKPQFNDCVGTIDRTLDPFGMGRLAVKLDAGNELSLKASNLEIACELCSSVFGEGNLVLCPTCEHVWTCAACKPQHACVDQLGKIGVVLGSSQGRLAIQHVSPSSPAAKSGLRVGDIILAIDGVPVVDPDHHPPIGGPIGSHVVLRVLREGHSLEQSRTVTLRRGREPKSAAMSAAMPGVKVLALLSQGPTVCHYKVQMETPGGAAPRIGLMSYNLATGQGNIMMPSEDGEGEDPLKMMAGAGGGQNGPASAEQALSDCCDLYKELSTLASKEQWGRVVGKEEKIRATVARLGETRTNSSSIRVCECVRVCAYAHSRARAHTHTHTLSLSLSHTHTHTHTSPGWRR